MGDSIPTSPLLTITKLIHIREPQNNSYSLAWHNLKLLTKFLTFIPQAPKALNSCESNYKGLVLEVWSMPVGRCMCLCNAVQRSEVNSRSLPLSELPLTTLWDRDSLDLASLLPFQQVSSKGSCLFSPLCHLTPIAGITDMCRHGTQLLRKSGSHTWTASTLPKSHSPAHGIGLLKNTLATKLESFFKKMHQKLKGYWF